VPPLQAPPPPSSKCAPASSPASPPPQARHSNLTAEARESAVSAQQSLSRQAETDRLRLIERHEAEASSLRSAAHQAEQTSAALTSRLHQTELSLREATNRNEALDQEVRLLRRQTAELRADNSELAAANHSLEKAAGASRVEVAALAASVTDKEALVAKSASLLDASNDARRALEETLATHKDNNTKLQSKLKVRAERRSPPARPAPIRTAAPPIFTVPPEGTPARKPLRQGRRC
jgi:predicted ribosome quality control (RQC) complex YloA/Tae2 family protein